LVGDETSALAIILSVQMSFSPPPLRADRKFLCVYLGVAKLRCFNQQLQKVITVEDLDAVM